MQPTEQLNKPMRENHATCQPRDPSQPLSLFSHHASGPCTRPDTLQHDSVKSVLSVVNLLRSNPTHSDPSNFPVFSGSCVPCGARSSLSHQPQLLVDPTIQRFSRSTLQRPGPMHSKSDRLRPPISFSLCALASLRLTLAAESPDYERNKNSKILRKIARHATYCCCGAMIP